MPLPSPGLYIKYKLFLIKRKKFKKLEKSKRHNFWHKVGDYAFVEIYKM